MADLTLAQKQALKAHILADPALAPKASGATTDLGGIEAALNAQASPTWTVWKTSVSTNEVGLAVNYIAVEAMTTANQDRIKTFYQMNPGSFDPSRADIRTFWDNTFSGALGGQGQATRDALTALWKRTATRAEKVLSTGTGSVATPAVLGWEGSISIAQVSDILAS